MSDRDLHYGSGPGGPTIKCSRSASICMGSGGMDGMSAAASAASPARRRPAARSQSARLSNAHRPQKKRPDHPIRSGNSDTRLDTAGLDSPTPSAFARRGSTRRSTMHRKSNAFLDVPEPSTPKQSLQVDQDSLLVRSFSFNSKGTVINRGDSFRKRRSRSNSLAGGGTPPPAAALPPLPSPDTAVYRVAMLGCQGVGKTALVSQFMSSECINAYDRQSDATQTSVHVMLNGEESELQFITQQEAESENEAPPDAFVVIYSIVDKASFQKAEAEVSRIAAKHRTKPIIIVANKIDLVRSRTISPQDGKCLACTYGAKFIEVSVGINHNVDELLVGILTQIRLKLSSTATSRDSNRPHWYNSHGVVRASMKARQVFTWIFGKEDSKFKNCENLHIL